MKTRVRKGWRVLHRTETIEIGDRYSDGTKPIYGIGKFASEIASPYKVYRKIKPRAKARKVAKIKSQEAFAVTVNGRICPDRIKRFKHDLEISGLNIGSIIRVKILPVK